ncbi:MAG: recombination-associated protein RdgC [Silvanigrellaceae bacterium]
MSLGAGALALRRLQILVDPKDVQFKDIIKKLKKKSISPLGLEDEREQSTGWCHPYSGEANFDAAHDHVYEQAFVFGMRTDVKRIPGTYFRLQMKNALEALNAKSKAKGEGGRGLNKKLRDATRDRLKLELLRGTLPSVRLIEIVWHLDSNELWLLSSSQAVYDEFEKLFLETFGWPLALYNPGTLGVDFDRLLRGMNVSLDDKLNLSPTDFRSEADLQRVGGISRSTDAEDLF